MCIFWSNSLFRLYNSVFPIVSCEPLCSGVMGVLLAGFCVIRSGYSYSVIGCGLCIFVLVLPLFLSLFFTGLFSRCRIFFSNFIPLGSPIWIAPFVSIIELISYFIRPSVLLFRPFVNLSIGCYCGLALGNLCFMYEGATILLFLLFLYEVFVAMMHWFIVYEILSFSVDH